MKRHVLHVTKICNMACRYCYEEDKTSGHRDWPSTKRLLDSLIAGDPVFELEFLGGEPCLHFDLVRQVVSYLQSKTGVNRTYYLTTNGTVLDEDILEYLRLNPNIRVGVSLDGNRVMNQFRVFRDGRGTWELVVANTKRLLQALGPERVIVHMVTHPYNIGYLVDGVTALYRLGVSIVDVGIVENTLPLTDEYKEVFIREHTTLSKLILDGAYPGLVVTTLEYAPGKNRKSITRDENGVVVAESYEDTGEEDLVYLLRKTVYDNHVQRGTSRWPS